MDWFSSNFSRAYPYLKNAHLLSPSSASEKPTFKEVYQRNDYVALYFLGDRSSFCRMFSEQFGRFVEALIRALTQDPSASAVGQLDSTAGPLKLVSVIVGSDKDLTSLSGLYPLYVLPAVEARAKARLLRIFKVFTLPTLVLISTDKQRVCAVDCRRELLEEPTTSYLGWRALTVSEVLAGDIVKFDRTKSDLSRLNQCIKGILFAAQWCPPCKIFVKKLVETYTAIKSRPDGQKFEIIFCSYDRSFDSFNQFFSMMPWYAIPFGDPRLSFITRTFCIREIPCLLLLDENNQIITRHGRCEALCDPLGKEFPWYPRSVIELNENTSYRLRQDVCLILFTEGTTEDLSFAQSALLPIAEDHFIDGYEPDLVFFYGGENPVCERALDTLGLLDMPLPMICIIDPFSASLFICENPNVSEEIIRNFIVRFERDELVSVPLKTKVYSDVKS